MVNIRILVCLIAVALAPTWGTAVQAAGDYPTEPIKLVVPFTAGSVQDLRARHIGGLLGPRLGQPVVVDNRPGANGVIGTSLVAKAKPDGHTLLLCTGATFAGNLALLPNLPYDPVNDFAPIVRLVTTSGIVAVSAASRHRSLGDLLHQARTQPKTVRYGSGASYSKVLGELLARRAGVQFVYVPYKGDGQALTDLLGGHIDIMFTTPILLVPHIHAARVRGLAIAGPHRLAALPDVPTTSEQNVQNSELLAWAGMCAPAGTPGTIVRRLNREALAAMMAPQVRAEVEHQGYAIAPNTPEAFAIFIKEDVMRVAALVKELGITMGR